MQVSKSTLGDYRKLVSTSGMVETSRLEGKRGFSFNRNKEGSRTTLPFLFISFGNHEEQGHLSIDDK
jgi:hypothetical protein